MTVRSLLLKVLRDLRKVVFIWLDPFVCAQKRPSETSSILLVRLDHIGDFILWLDSAQYFRIHYPDKYIVLVANPVWSDLARQFSYWDEVWPLQLKAFTKNPFYRWVFLRRVYCAGFEIAIQPTLSRSFLKGDSLIRASMATHRIGSETDLINISPQERSLSNNWYTQLIPSSPHLLAELERNAKFMNGLGVTRSSARIATLARNPSTISYFELPLNYFVIFPGASNYKRQWPVERFAEIASYIHQKTGWPMVICGTKEEEQLAKSLMRLANVRTYNLAGKTTLTEFIEVVGGAQILIGNETSAIHISASVQTESVCILGGGHFGRFMPYPTNIPGLKPMPVYYKMNCYGCDWKCSQPHAPDSCWPCISAISVESVRDSVNHLLGKRLTLPCT